MRLTSFYCVALIALVVCLGCGETGSTVQGPVTIDGQLVPRGTVIFHPSKDGPTAYGTIDNNGTYALRVGQGDMDDPNAAEIEPGDYIVTVVVNMRAQPGEAVDKTAPPKPGPRLTAAKYANKETSDLRVTVKPGRNVIPLELESAPPEDVEPVAEASDDGSAPAPSAEESTEAAGAAGETASKSAPATGGKTSTGDDSSPPVNEPAATPDDDSDTPAESDQSAEPAEEQNP